jgi:integrase
VRRITQVIGGVRVQSLNVTDARRLLTDTTALAEWSRYGMLRVLRQVLKMARDEGLIVRDPTEALQPHERPRQRSRRKGRRLSPAELAAVIDTAERIAPSFAPLVVLLAYTGVRLREALGLRWGDVDLEAATIRLRFQLAVDDRRRVPLKTEAGARDLPILPALRRRLVEHRLASPWTRPGDPVFATTAGRPKAYRNVRRALDTVGADLGVDLVSHDFRRSLASFLIVAARADEAAVTAVTGHASIETTRRVYAGDWREAEERNAVVLRQLAAAGIDSDGKCRPMATPDPPSFDESLDLLRVRLRDADALNPSKVHSFRELMEDQADVLPDQFYWDAFDELEALGHLNPNASGKVGGGDALGRLSADGRLHLRQQDADDPSPDD